MRSLTEARSHPTQLRLAQLPVIILRDITGALKTVTLSKMPDNRYYASLLIDDPSPQRDTSSDGKAIEIDLGLIDFAVTSDGSKYQNPKQLNKRERNLKRKQRQLSGKKDKTTGKRHKAKVVVAKVYSKIARIREDFLHKLSRKIVNENQVIVVENLAVKNMVKNHNLAKSIHEAGWGMFCTMLKYKAEVEGKVYLEIDRFFPDCRNFAQ